MIRKKVAEITSNLELEFIDTTDYLNLKARLFGGDIHDMISDTIMIKCVKLENFIILIQFNVILIF